MENTIKNAIIQYVDNQLYFAVTHPEDAQLYEHNAFGAVELACQVLNAQKAYWTSKELEDRWASEWVNLFHQLYR